MKFTFDVGDQEKCRITFSRNPFTGKTTVSTDSGIILWNTTGPTPVTVQGKTIALKTPTDLGTHYSFESLNRYELTVGKKEKHPVVIEHERPGCVGGLLPNKYRAFVDSRLVAEHSGF